MPTNTILLVLIARDAGMRSSLAARLGMSGADLLTIEGFDDPRIAREQHRRVVLVADQDAVDGHGAGIHVLADDPRWYRLVLVSDAPGVDGPRLIRVLRKDAGRAIAAMLESWQVEI
ncbi:MAG: hypothetical protein EOP58_05260 [Sphingomonadales bacterium]|nr:MAG: hypothetical protein EOP58_05260 [Sphingomonadales bacterium]